MFGVKALEDFAQHGRIERAFTDLEKIHLLPAMKNTLRDYEQYGKDRLQLRPSTLRTRTRELTIFLDFLNTRKARTLDQIQALDLSEFLSSRGHLKPHTVSRIVSDVRSFLRFLTMRGILQKDLSAELPTIRVPRDASIPSVWDHELIIKLLGAIDRSSAKGKRDYAILLLACRLGLRAGDIRTLKLDHLHWEDSRIEITQSKTTTPLSLPLTEEVGEALIDYLRSGRPKTADREVFLKLNPPFDPFRRDQQPIPHCYLLAPTGGDHIPESTKARNTFPSPQSGDSASGAGYSFSHHCGHLGAYQFGIDTHLRQSRCGSLAQRGVGY